MDFFLLLPGAFFAPIIHEWVKARVSATLGDPVPRNSGFLRWNPLKYFEPIGFFFMMMFHVGWGRPVPTSPLYYKDRRMGTILVHTAPILANLLVGMLAAFLWTAILRDALFARAGASEWGMRTLVYTNRAMHRFVQMNIGLAVFSLIPVFPMGGSKLLQLFVSPETSMRLNHYEKPMQIILILMLIFGMLQMLIFPIRDFIFGLVW
ncbi:MAG: site-2 protease family protein [Defluviitaleaceae bacterium]|nr:site-2 protease family protein [Defluviitaleaceae bacterium]